jgi:HK97 family phage prohead protease
MRTKTFPARIKLAGDADGTELEDAATDSEVGQFEALVSVFGVKDSYGEVVMPGAFTKTLADWEESGDPIPVYWSHRMDDPDFNIGHVLEAKETEDGLYVKAQLDLDNPKAQSTHNLMRTRRVTQFSFSFQVPPGGATEGQDAVELNEIDLYEVGPTPVGANPATELIGVKAGRVLSEKNVTAIKDARTAMRAADQQLAALLKQAGSGDDDEEKSAVRRRAKDEEPVRAKSEEPAGEITDPASALAYIQLITT